MGLLAEHAELTETVVAGPGAERATTYTPFTGEPLAELPVSTPADVEGAYAMAREAQQRWAQVPLSERSAVFLRLHDLLLDRQAEVLDLVQLETGKARRHALEELVDVALNARHYARSARRYLAPVRHAGLVPVLSSARELRHPKGVVGIVSPWNYPLTLAVSDAIPAFLAGNAVVHKPDTQTALTALWIRALAVEAGLPADLWQVVVGDGPVIGRAVVDGGDFVCFTGSTPVGREVAERCARRLVGCSLELGGKNPMLVLGDADLDRAAEGAVRDSFSNAGQLCISMERIYAVESVHDAFLDRFVGRVRALRLGSDLGYGRDMGSLISARQLERVTAHVDDAVAKGATVLAGGRARPDLGPYFYEPTVLSGVREDMALCRDETFGPVVAVYGSAGQRRGSGAGQRLGVRAQRVGLDPGRRPRPPRRGAHPHRHGEHQRDVRRGLGRHPRADGRRQGLRARPAARARRHPQVHRAANRCGATAARLRAAAVGVVRHLGPRLLASRCGPSRLSAGDDRVSYDVVVVGSGFGGSVTALRLAEKGYRVLVLEAGRRFADDEFARTSWDLRRFLWAPRLGCFGIQRIHRLPDVTILAGAGVGGGSLVYANTLYRPDEAFYDDPQWRDITDWRAELAPAYDLASRMLGVTQNPTITASDVAMRTVADQMGVGHTFALTPVGVFFGEAAGRTVPDPYFGGAGPDRTGCIECGECMTGCRHGAKNTLVKNYLYLAEQLGVEVRPLTTVCGLRAVPGGWQVETERTGAWFPRRTRDTVTAVAGRARRRHLGDAAAAAPDARLRQAPAPVAAAR